MLVSRVVPNSIKEIMKEACFHAASDIYIVPTPRENNQNHQETQAKIPSHHQSSMAEDQMRVHTDSSVRLLLFCLSTILRDCTEHCSMNSGIGQMRNRADCCSTLWPCDDSSCLHATMLPRVCCPKSLHGHTKHGLCHLADRTCSATEVSQVWSALSIATYFLSVSVETFRRS